jgi:hypothetical protein
MSRTCIVILILLLACCGVANAEEQNSLTDYGNGVLFFFDSHEMSPPGFDTYQEFGTALSQYLSDHPEKRVVSMVPDGSAGYGAARGFYVVVENKTPDLIIRNMNCTPTWDGTRAGTTALADYHCVVET